MSRPVAEVLPQAWQLRVGGRVQGVGFRPFVYRLAARHGLTGWVRNTHGQVEIMVRGMPAVLSQFREALLAEAPSIAAPELLACHDTGLAEHADFRILDSTPAGPADIHLPVDHHCCEDCLRELDDPDDRRHRYPFINCTQCGPRYTLIEALPYDRAQTAMADFALCPDCEAEYGNPADRRFHAEPLACPNCGPRLHWHDGDVRQQGNEASLAACVDALHNGRIVAVKGVGGYHLMCDANDADAIAGLRERKGRPHKPLAVLFADRPRVENFVHLSDAQAACLASTARPIVLAARRVDCRLPDSLAPGLNELGVMLPDSPLRHLLVRDFGGPLVCTSANLSGEPVLTDGDEVARRLSDVADAFLHHDRPILRPADDSLFRELDGVCRPLRLGRGSAPLELSLPGRLSQPVLAVGGHMKNSIALGWEDRCVVSPHIGDLETPRSHDLLVDLIHALQKLYGVQVERVVCDAHPGYASSRWAAGSGLPVTRVFHHHAHASVLPGEYPDVDRWLVFTWDGVGLGEDGSLWGGEALLGNAGDWQRVASLRPFRLPGGDKASRQPWRSALGLGWEAGREWTQSPADTTLLHSAWQQGLNAPSSSAAGRLFDAAAALTDICQEASYEGQAPLWLEHLAGDIKAAPIDMPMAQDETGAWRSDWAPLLDRLMDTSREAAQRAACFHASMARCLVDQARCIREREGDFSVGLSGGVFQNRRLVELAVADLRAEGFEVYLPQQVPLNDGGLCFGQLMEALHCE